MQHTINLIIQLLSGACGGNLAGGIIKRFSLGTLLNSILGIVGGGLCGQFLNSVGFGDTGGPGTDIWSVIANIMGGGIGGGILIFVIGAIKRAFGKQAPVFSTRDNDIQARAPRKVFLQTAGIDEVLRNRQPVGLNSAYGGRLTAYGSRNITNQKIEIIQLAGLNLAYGVRLTAYGSRNITNQKIEIIQLAGLNLAHGVRQMQKRA